MIRTRKCAYQAVKNVSFLENFANVLNELSPQNEWALSILSLRK